MRMTIDEQLYELGKTRMVIENTWLKRYITLGTEHIESNADLNVREGMLGRFYVKKDDKTIQPLDWIIDPQIWRYKSSIDKTKALVKVALKSPIMTDEIVKALNGAERGIIEL